MSFSREVLFQSPWPYRVMRIGLGLVFVWAGAVKLMAPRAFARSLSGYGLLPEELMAPVAIGLPVVELLAGMGLLFDLRGSLKVISGLLGMFLALLAFAIMKNLDVDCGCFSTAEIDAHRSLRIAFAGDLGMGGVAAYLFLWKRFQNRSAAACQSQRSTSQDLKEELA